VLDKLSILSADYLWYLIIGIAIVCFFIRPWHEKIHLVIFAALVLVLVFLVSLLAGALYYDPRPFVVGHYTPLIPHKSNNGFPSDHVLWSSAIAAIIFPSSRYLSLVLWLLTAAVGIARVYVGLHHATDVIGSMVIAAVVAALVYYSLKRLNVVDRLRNFNLKKLSLRRPS